MLHHFRFRTTFFALFIIALNTHAEFITISGTSYDRASTELDLSEKKLKEIPLQVLQFPNFRKLNLSKSHISKIRPEIIELVKLRELDLSYNSFEVFPENLLGLAELTKLDLMKTGLIEISAQIDQLAHLEEFNIGENKLTSVPEGLFRLGRLKRLIIADNAIETLPLNINNLQQFEYFNAIKINLIYLQTASLN